MPWTTTDEFNVIPKTQRMSLASFPRPPRTSHQISHSVDSVERLFSATALHDPSCWMTMSWTSTQCTNLSECIASILTAYVRPQAVSSAPLIRRLKSAGFGFLDVAAGVVPRSVRMGVHLDVTEQSMLDNQGSQDFVIARK